MSSQQIDHFALLPLYAAAGTAILALLADLFVGKRAAVAGATLLGAVATAAAALATGNAAGTFCVPEGACSWVPAWPAAVTAVLFAGLTAGVLAFSLPALRLGVAPAGEFCFLLACSMTGGVVVGYAGDLITLIVGLETLTLPLYVLVGLRRTVPAPAATSAPAAPAPAATSAPAAPAPAAPAPAATAPATAFASSAPAHLSSSAASSAASASVTFFLISVVSTAVALLGIALNYAATGGVHLDLLTAGEDPFRQLAGVGVALLVIGLAFKVAAVPLHAWAPATYDGAPVPVAAYLSTASKLGGVIALAAIVSRLEARPVVVILAILTMTVGNLVALRQTRMVRLLAWSSVAQAGYILAALALGEPGVVAALAYAAFFVVLEFVAFGAVVALRPPGADGGEIEDYRGAGRTARLPGAAMVLALAGLAGLPPGLAGLFAKVSVVDALVDAEWTWLAGVVLINAVIALAYYVRVGAILYNGPAPAPTRIPRPITITLVAGVAVAVALGFAPQLLFNALS